MTPAHGKIRRAAMQCLAGSLAIAFLTLVCLRLQINLATTELLYLMVIVLLSLMGSFLVSTVLALLAVGCLTYFFSPPSFSFRVSDPREAIGILAFVTTATVTLNW